MKLMPLLTAILVCAALYALVFQRTALVSFAQDRTGFGFLGGPGAPEAEVAPDADVVAAPDTQPVADERTGAVSVVAMVSDAVTVDSQVILRGRTEAARSVEVRAETAGLILSEPLRKGTFVEAGDRLCEVDPGTRASALIEAQARLVEAQARLPEAQSRVPAARASLAEATARRSEGTARVAEALARLTEASINENAARRLSEGGFASETRVVGAEATLESARAGVTSAEASVDGIESQIASAEAGIEGAIAAVEGARAAIQSAEASVASVERDIARLTIAAPFAGLLETDTAELGSLLQPGGLCATIVQLDPIKLVGFVPEADLDKIEVGSLAGARLASGREVGGRVTFLSRSGDEQTRTFRLEIEVPNTDLSIRDGQTADILVAADGRVAHLLPQSALTLDDAGRLGVRTVAPDDTALFMPVSLLRDTVDGVWVADLPDTVNVIVTGQEYVIDGVAVTPTYTEAKG